MSAVPLTPARMRGLRLLAEGPARYSNMTDELGSLIYWQTADWLIGQGYATRRPFESGSSVLDVVITPAGVALLAELVQP